MRVGILGCGGMGREHTMNLAATPGVEVVVVADPVQAAVDRALQLAPGAVGSLDPATVAGDPSLDAVVVASIDSSHASLAIAAMQAGSFVLCEKPLSDSLAGAEAMMEAEVESGRRWLQIGFMREDDLAHRQLAAAMADLGELQMLRCVHRNANASVPSRSTEEILVQSIIHDIHSVRWLGGAEIVAVETSTVARSGGGVGFVHLVAELDSDAVATIDFDDLAFGYEVTVEANCTGGMAVSAGPTRATLSRQGVRSTDIGTDWFGWFTDAYRTQIVNWAERCREGMVGGPSTWDGLAAQYVVEAALEAERGGRAAVALPSRPGIY